ncbi:MAG: hypothetical protein B7Y40_08935 [Gammaproteobacteria bacterium 28-57-27]|nr:MAG: hypothetical protein B7Y40_08935 [Gammaproteobacteria bacterium 28-57-27]
MLDGSMNSPIFTNVATYKEIAADAFESMRGLIDSGRKPKDDGSGWILQFDPKQQSFRQAMIVIVFVGMWLDALLHLLIVRDHSGQKFRELDFKSYEEKLQLLGVSDQAILESAARYRKARKELVHEKAHFDSGELKSAQDEADNAYQLLLAIDSALVGQPPQ